MSNTISEIIVLVAIFCYLSASSIALAHGGSWVSGNADSTVVNSTFVKQDDLNGKSSDKEPLEDSMSPSCHNKDNNADRQANVGCELLCSAIGHVMLDYDELFIDQSLPTIEADRLYADLVTRQLIVEKRPPK